jgi:hypothetical protein
VTERYEGDRAYARVPNVSARDQFSWIELFVGGVADRGKARRSLRS